MLLVELTINSVLNRISQEGIALTNWWENAILAFDSPQLRSASKYGGYAEMNFGSMTLTPDLFSGDWPPPFSCAVTVKYTATTEAAAETLFTGTCHLSSITREGVIYSFYGPSYDTVISSSTAFADTLEDVVTWFCDASRLNLSTDYTYARGTSPTVAYTTTSDQVAISLLSDMCAFFSHVFYISGSTLYLVDMLLDNGSRTITEYNYFPSQYEIDAPIASFSNGTYTQTSSYPYGTIESTTSYCTVQAQIETALDNLILVGNKFGCRLRLPFIGSLPVIGEKISWIDKSLGTDTCAYIRCRAIQYNFDQEEIIVEGEGEVTDDLILNNKCEDAEPTINGVSLYENIVDVALSTEQAHTGTKSLKIVKNDTAASASTFFLCANAGLEDGTSYDFSVWAYIPSGQTITTLNFGWLDSSVVGHYPDYCITFDQWVQLTGTFTMDSSYAFMYVVEANAANTDYWYLDDFSCKPTE